MESVAINVNSLDTLISKISQQNLQKNIIIKNESGEFVYISPSQSQRMGFINEREWLLRKDANMPCDFAEASPQLDKAWDNARKNLPSDTLHFANYADGVAIEICYSRRVCCGDKFLGECGVLYDLQPNQHVSNTLNNFNKKFGAFDLCSSLTPPANLSKIKHYILCLLSLGFSTAEITFVLNTHLQEHVSINTVKYHIRTLIDLFQLDGTEQLIEYSIANGLHRQISSSYVLSQCFLMPRQSY